MQQVCDNQNNNISNNLYLINKNRRINDALIHGFAQPREISTAEKQRNTSIKTYQMDITK